MVVTCLFRSTQAFKLCSRLVSSCTNTCINTKSSKPLSSCETVSKTIRSLIALCTLVLPPFNYRVCDALKLANEHIQVFDSAGWVYKLLSMLILLDTFFNSSIVCMLERRTLLQVPLKAARRSVIWRTTSSRRFSDRETWNSNLHERSSIASCSESSTPASHRPQTLTK